MVKSQQSFEKMYEQSSTCQFCSKKMKKIVWQNVRSEDFQCNRGDSGLISNDRFCTGSWDDDGNNEISMWSVEIEAEESATDDVIMNKEYKLVKCASFFTSASIMDLQFISPEKLLYSSIDGDLTLLDYSLSTANFRRVNSWNGLHEAPCSSFSFFGDEVVTAGEDGRLNLVNIHRKKSTPVLTSIGSAQYYCIDRFGTKEIVVGNAVGQLQLFDIRQNEYDGGCKTLLPANDHSGSATSVRCHPSQPHLTVVGHQNGRAAFWDLRRADSPAAVLPVNNGPIWDIRFHEFYPNNIFTASNDGSLVHWDMSNVQTGAENSPNNMWLVNDLFQKRLKLSNLLPENVFSVNSISVSANSVLCSTDNEVIWMLNNLKFC